MDSFNTVAKKLFDDPVAWKRVQKELAAAEDRKARLIELAGEYGMDLDAKELSRAVDQASRELKEDELESVSGGTLSYTTDSETELIGLLVPAVQKVREPAAR